MQILSIIIFRNREGKILLQFRNSGAFHNPLNWSFFGGLTDHPDELPLQGVIREVKEELGIDLKESDVSLLCERFWINENTKDEQTVFLYEAVEPIDWKDFDLHEGAGAAFFTKEEIAKLGEISILAKTFVADHC